MRTNRKLLILIRDFIQEINDEDFQFGLCFQAYQLKKLKIITQNEYDKLYLYIHKNRPKENNKFYSEEQEKSVYFWREGDQGKNIYAGDTVELFAPMETRTPWQSIVYWDMLHGAWVMSHPVHISLLGSKMRELYPLLNQVNTPIYTYGVEDPEFKIGYVKKIKSYI